MMELKDVKHVAIGTHTRGIRMIEFNDYGKRFAPPEYEFEDKKLYTAEQMQEYAKAKAFEVAEELLEPERARNELIEMIFKEVQDEEV